jgi:hypothetical protein
MMLHKIADQAARRAQGFGEPTSAIKREEAIHDADG